MKRFKNILFYTDGNGDSDPALSRAVELAQRNLGRLTVVGGSPRGGSPRGSCHES